MLVASGKPTTREPCWLWILNLRTVQTCLCTGRTTTFRINSWALKDVTLIFGILQSVSVDQSGGLGMETGVLYFFHATLVLAELIVCSSSGFACILAK